MSVDQIQEKFSIEIRSLTFYLNVNATEDIKKVKACVLNLMPEDFNENQIISHSYTGGYGNSIVNLSLIIEDKNITNHVINLLADSFSDYDKQILTKEFYNRLDRKSVFFFRIKKTKLFENIIKLSNKSDVVKIEIRFSYDRTKLKPSDLTENLRKYLINRKLLADI